MAEGVKYIKIAKIDGDGIDQTITLQSLTELTIPYSTGNVTYDILSISEQPTYFLYSVDNPNIEHADRALLKYDVTASLNSVLLTGGSPPVVNPRTVQLTTITDNLGFLEDFSDQDTYTSTRYKFKTYPQKIINLQASGSLSIGSNTGNNHKIFLADSNDQQIGNAITVTGTGEKEFNVSASIDHSSSFAGDSFSLKFQNTSQNATPTCVFSSSARFFITTTDASGPTMETIPEPFLTQDFSRAFDCQPTFNNILNNRLSTKYQDIDSSDLLSPVNFDLLISGSALKAEVQDSNYTSLRVIRPRYEGSRNTTDNFNTSSISSSLSIESSQNIYLGPSLLNLPSVSSLDPIIAEFKFGGGTYPEIATGGAVLLSQILNVGSKDSISIIPLYDKGFRDIIHQKFPIHSKPNLTQYTTISSNTQDAKVIGTYIGVPSRSNYIAVSSTPLAQVEPLTTTTIVITSSIKEVSTNSSGNYVTASYTPTLNAHEVILSSLSNGHRWYFTIYNTLPDVVQGALDPFNSGSSFDYTITDSNGNLPEPLAKNGVYEITSMNSITKVMTIFPPLPEIGWEAGAGDKGCLIWRSSGGEDVTFDGATLSGVGKGNLITTTPSNIIKENLTYITKTYGTNT